MNPTGLTTFDEAEQISNRWLNELMRAVDWDDKHRAYRLLRATLHALRDCLTPQEVVQFGAQLPMLIRGLYYEGWHISDMARNDRSKKGFLAHIEVAFKQDPNTDTEGLTREVLRFLASKISPGEIGDVKQILRADLRALWPDEPAKEARAT